MSKGPNIVQVEYFLTSRASFEKMQWDVKQRIADGLKLALRGHELPSLVKPVLRFYDSRGKLTEHALKIERAVHHGDILLTRYVSAPKIKQFSASKTHQRNAADILKLKKEARKLAVQELKEELRLGHQISIEISTGRGIIYRELKANEAHEIVETVSKTTGVWLFVRGHGVGDLTVDTPLMFSAL